MKFTMTHRFECPAEQLWDIFDDPEFDRRLEEATGVRREVLQSSTEGAVEHKLLRCVSLKEMPAMMAKALGTESFEFEQANALDRQRGELAWKVKPAVLADRVEAQGVTRVQSEGTGCVRTIEGEISIRIPLVGKKMEGKLSENIKSSYEEAARIAREMVAERGLVAE
ncbi:hypothetical protein DL240_11225 [Lujinxingia litoralis]|uniref:DUF2505 domain-containing protein n=1 Tax=Lujinxingia litoralis TaxID=2211119 RepID=A0A328C515_9DELT|nr:DUF2505 domain-containing protein [Lujinxingia litoralis]RAL22411.1 hypothetical protein DL240_11225 [Lujinxingia litoralis]